MRRGNVLETQGIHIFHDEKGSSQRAVSPRNVNHEIFSPHIPKFEAHWHQGGQRGRVVKAMPCYPAYQGIVFARVGSNPAVVDIVFCPSEQSFLRFSPVDAVNAVFVVLFLDFCCIWPTYLFGPP